MSNIHWIRPDGIPSDLNYNDDLIAQAVLDANEENKIRLSNIEKLNNIKKRKLEEEQELIELDKKLKAKYHNSIEYLEL